MSRTPVPNSLKESLLKGEYVRRLYHRDSEARWVPMGWAILDATHNPLYTLTDNQVHDVENMYELLFTQTDLSKGVEQE
jgi:hypothetical protein